MRAHQVGKLVHEVKTVRRTCGAGRGIFATLAWRSAHLQQLPRSCHDV